MPFLALRIIAGPNWSQTRNSLGTNVGRALVEDADDVVLLDLLRDAGPELTLHVPRSLTSLGRQVLSAGAFRNPSDFCFSKPHPKKPTPPKTVMQPFFAIFGGFRAPAARLRRGRSLLSLLFLLMEIIEF